MQSNVCKEEMMLEFGYCPDTMEQILHFTSSRDTQVKSPLVLHCRRRQRRGRRTRTAIKKRKIQVNEGTEMMLIGKETH